MSNPKFELKQTVFSFWSKFPQKEYFQSIVEKMNFTIEFITLEISLGTAIHLKRTILNFLTKFDYNALTQFKTKKVDICTEFIKLPLS